MALFRLRYIRAFYICKIRENGQRSTFQRKKIIAITIIYRKKLLSRKYFKINKTLIERII